MGELESPIQREDADGVRTLRIDRPDRANALTAAMADRLRSEFSNFDADPAVRVLVLTGTGDRTFCGGADLAELAAEEALSLPFVPVLPVLYRACRAVSKPTLAALNGTAAGGGLELALACDIRMAVEGARLLLPEVRMGMCATFGVALLARSLPLSAALEAVWTGTPIRVEEAMRHGLVRSVHPREALMPAVRELASRIAAMAPLAVQKIKAVAQASLDGPLELALRVGPDLYESVDRTEGLRAWREGRPPNWEGR